MTALAVKLTESEINQVGIELERLFRLQDKHLDASKKADFVMGIFELGLPFGAIVSGIRKLCDAELRYITLRAINEAARSFVTYESEYEHCDLCKDTGNVYLENQLGYVYAMPCRCERGHDIADAQKLVPWNGARVQKVFKDVRKLVWPDPVTHGIGMPDDESQRVAEQFGGEVSNAGVAA